jgi:hypothetical protein
MKTRSVALTAFVSLCLATAALAQGSRGSAAATIGGEKVEIDYGRPELKGRDIAELMEKLPPDRIWRAGENQVSTLTSAADLVIGGTKVPAGKYSVYVHADETGGWSLILNEDLGVPLGKMWDQAPDDLKNEPWPHLRDYAEAIKDKEVVRAPMKKAAAAEPVDPFTMSFSPRGQGADLTLAWGDQAWKVEVEPAK